MTRLLLVFGFLALLITPATAARAANSGVSIRIVAGFNGYYRPSAWAPVRISLLNHTPSVVSGTVTVRGAADDPPAARYAEPVALAPGASKNIELNVPGTDVEGTVLARFQSSTVQTETAAYPNAFGDTDFVVGALSDDPESVAWLRSVRPIRQRLRVVPLDATSLDTSPDALATFDAIVVTNADTSRLDSEQSSALQRYVSDGGALILVGGPSWQATLSSLPSALLPGLAAGTRNLPNLRGLHDLGYGVPPQHLLAVTALTHPRGVVLAAQSGVPLVVKDGVGDGQVEYLAFDPSGAPIVGWRGASALLTSLVPGAAPLATRRAGLMPVDRATSFLDPGPGPVDLAAELSNLPTPPLRTILLLPAIFGGLALLTLVGAVLILRRQRRRPLAWSAVLALIAAAVLAGLNLQPLARQGAVVNSLNVVLLGGSGPQPADRYVSVLSPVSGDYTLTYPNPADARDVLPVRVLDLPSASQHPATFTEGESTQIQLPGVQTWTSRAVQLRTRMYIPGGVDTQLHLDAQGRLVGTIVNRTAFPLLRPAVVAGQSYVRLPTIQSGARVPVRLLPHADVWEHSYTEQLTRVYGETVPDYSTMLAGRSIAFLPGRPPGIPADRTLDQRIRNAVSSLPETHLLSAIGEISFVAWTDRTLDPIDVSGTAAVHRDLTLLVQPIAVKARHGQFALPTGVVGARPVEVRPAAPQFPAGGATVQPIVVGPGGSASFAFQMPTATYHVLFLDLYAGGIDTTVSDYTGVPSGTVQAYDWTARRWRQLRFSGGSSRLVKPNRYISYTGALLIRLQPTESSGSLSILDPRSDLQVHGAGAA